MCMAKLYETKDGDKAIVEGVSRITIAEGRVEVETLFGEKMVFEGDVRQVDFLKSRIQMDSR